MVVKRKYIFEKSVAIKCNLKELFKFHLDTNNLPEISPPFPRAKVKKISEIPLQKGSTVIVSLNFFLFKTDWEILIEELEENKLIGDFQTKGIFDYWYHSHIFDLRGNQVIMTDKVEFIPPLGVLGRILIPLIQLQLFVMFNHRHKKTKLIFER